ncbi:MAG: Stp1/IreP family PP2C-type Ser/Thr phosphatase [Burkholderiales bacterium]
MPTTMIPALEIAARTDRGRVRSINEDCVAARAEAGFAVLADGMGGHNAGEVASQMAVRLIAEWLEQRRADMGTVDGSAARSLLASAIERANAEVFKAGAEQARYRGMGTTIVAALWHGAAVTLAHVGDSRAYRLRKGTLEVITRDHTLVQEQLERGLITLAQARIAANRNVLTRAVGTDTVVEIDFGTHDVEPQDLYLLCSDGLHDMLSERAIEETLAAGAHDPGLGAESLVRRANEAGGLDNVSVVLVRVLSTPQTDAT